MAKTTKNFLDVIRAEMAADPELAKAVDEERLHADIAEQIVRLRTEANLTQKQLAEKSGMKQSAISRIEDADYYGHSLKSLNRIAYAFNKRIAVVFCPADCVRQVIYHVNEWATDTIAKMEPMSFGNFQQFPAVYVVGVNQPLQMNAQNLPASTTPVGYVPPLFSADLILTDK